MQPGIDQPDEILDNRTREFDIEGFRHACRLWTMVLEISELMAPTQARKLPPKLRIRHWAWVTPTSAPC